MHVQRINIYRSAYATGCIMYACMYTNTCSQSSIVNMQKRLSIKQVHPPLVCDHDLRNRRCDISLQQQHRAACSQTRVRAHHEGNHKILWTTIMWLCLCLSVLSVCLCAPVYHVCAQNSRMSCLILHDFVCLCIHMCVQSCVLIDKRVKLDKHAYAYLVRACIHVQHACKCSCT